MNFAQKYRPERFADVVGQSRVVKVLTSLIVSDKARPRNLLFCGSHASGKTTMARIYAKALNCAAVDANGSPCNRCSHCTDPELDGLFEYDVPALGGGAAEVSAWVARHYNAPIGFKTKILFFDEAHCLTDEAVETFLKRVEETIKGVCFVFATTEPHNIKLTLRSRLVPLEVRALGLADAVALLRQVADAEGINYEVEALALLASIKRGYPRDLLIGLEQVAISAVVSTATVKDIFGLDQTDRLVQYFLALADGDSERQTGVFLEWPDDLSTKIEWVQAFLTSLYYRNIRGGDVILDGLTYSIKVGRVDIVERFVKRLKINLSELGAYWEPMMSFWDAPLPDNEAGLNLRLALFHDLVNRQLPEAAASTDARVKSFGFALGSALESGEVHTVRHTGRDYTKSDEVEKDSGTAPAPVAATGDSYSLGLEDVFSIVGRSSSFVQEHGTPMNAAFQVYPSQEPAYADEVAASVVERFVGDLEKDWAEPHEPIATIALCEKRESGAVMGWVLAYLPRIDQKEHRLRDWCAGFGAAEGREYPDVVELEIADRSRDMQFHWRQVRALCAGLGGDAFLCESALRAREVLRHLRVRGLREPNALTVPPLRFGGDVADAALLAATQNGMDFLSAVDDGAWGWVMNGWELKEHPVRKKEADRRRDQIRQLGIYSADKAHFERQRHEVAAQWLPPKLRPRRNPLWNAA